MPTGATVAALTTSLPETPGGERNWDYRFTWMRDSTFTLQALHFLNLDWEADEFMQFVADLEANEDGGAPDHVRDRRPARPHRVDAGRPLRLCGRQPGADRQRRLRPAPERRLRRGARLDPSPHPPHKRLPRRLWPIVQSQAELRDEGLEASPTRESGRRAASPSTTCPRSSCAGWPWTGQRSSRQIARRPGARERPGARTADEIKADILEHGVTGRRAPAALRHRSARCIHAAGSDLRLPPGRRRDAAQVRARDRRRPRPRTASCCATAPARPTTACRARRAAS